MASLQGFDLPMTWDSLYSDASCIAREIWRPFSSHKFTWLEYCAIGFGSFFIILDIYNCLVGPRPSEPSEQTNDTEKFIQKLDRDSDSSQTSSQELSSSTSTSPWSGYLRLLATFTIPPLLTETLVRLERHYNHCNDNTVLTKPVANLLHAALHGVFLGLHMSTLLNLQGIVSWRLGRRISVSIVVGMVLAAIVYCRQRFF